MGTAYIFSPHCGQIPFQVKGAVLDDDERIVLTGQAPRVGPDCHPYATYTSNLEFRRLKPNEEAQFQEPLPAGQLPAAGVSKSDAPLRTGDELPSAPTAQPSVKTETPVAAKDSPARAADANMPSTSTAQPSVTTETPGAKNLDYYKWGAATIVMIAWLLIVLFGKTLIRRKA